MFHVKCKECGWETDMQLRHTKQAKVCKHKTLGDVYINTNIVWKNKRIGNIFRGMKARCYDLNDKNFKWYGAKGIVICDEWLKNPISFEEWSLENGYADNLTIDRIKEEKNYCPENCRWITLEDNSRRAGNVNWITVNGETLTGRQWAEKFNLSNHTINDYIRNYGLERTILLIQKMIDSPPSIKQRKSHQTWFNVYGLE